MRSRVLRICLDGRPPLGQILAQRLDEVPPEARQGWLLRLLIAGLIEEQTGSREVGQSRVHPAKESLTETAQPIQAVPHNPGPSELGQLASLIG